MKPIILLCLFFILSFPVKALSMCLQTNHQLVEEKKNGSVSYFLKNLKLNSPIIQFNKNETPTYLGVNPLKRNIKEFFFKTVDGLFKVKVIKKKVTTSKIELPKGVNISELEIVSELFNSNQYCSKNITLSIKSEASLIFHDNKHAYKLESDKLIKFKNQVQGKLKNITIFRLSTLDQSRTFPVYKMTDDLDKIIKMRSNIVKPGIFSKITAIRTNFYKDSKYIYYGSLRLDSISYSFKPFDISRKDVDEIQVLLRKNSIRLLDNLYETAVPEDNGESDLIP